MHGSRVVLTLAAALCVATTASSTAGAAGKAPKLSKLRCVPTACKGSVNVRIGDTVALSGKRLAKGQRATFRWSKGSTSTKVVRIKGVGLAVKVPRKTPIGTVKLTLKDRKGRRSNAKKLRVVLPTKVSPTKPVTSTTPGPATGGNAVPGVFAGTSMWIWELDETEGGNLDAIAAKAREAGLSTLYVKSSDGSGSFESQFSRAMVEKFHAAGFNVCAWAYIYGNNPLPEAAVSAEAIQAGADCFVINAEAQYAGKYAQAQQYLAALRAAPGVGNDYPIGFSSIGRLGTEPQVPVSVFLGPRGGAQVAMPQVYWRDFDTPVIEASRSIAAEWRIYGRPIVPMGQTDKGATADDVLQFRAAWQRWGAVGTSWFRWGVGSPEAWNGLSDAVPFLGAIDEPDWRVFASGQNADGARWAQQHLARFDPSITIDGQFGPATAATVRRFQEARGLLPTTGSTGPRTWQALLKEPYTYVDWATGTRSAAR